MLNKACSSSLVRLSHASVWDATQMKVLNQNKSLLDQSEMFSTTDLFPKFPNLLLPFLIIRFSLSFVLRQYHLYFPHSFLWVCTTSVQVLPNTAPIVLLFLFIYVFIWLTSGPNRAHERPQFLEIRVVTDHFSQLIMLVSFSKYLNLPSRKERCVFGRGFWTTARDNMWYLDFRELFWSRLVYNWWYNEPTRLRGDLLSNGHWFVAARRCGF